MLAAKCFAPYSRGPRCLELVNDPLQIPSGVEATVSGQTVEVKGPKGTRSFTATDDVTLSVDDGAITVSRAARPSARASNGA